MHSRCVRAYHEGEACCVFCERELDDYYRNLDQQSGDNSDGNLYTS